MNSGAVYYEDRVLYSEKVHQIAYRGGSVEHNVMSADVRALRISINGCWFISSVQGAGSEPTPLRPYAEPSRCPGFSDAQLYSGSTALGVPLSSVDFEYIAKLVSEVCGELEAGGVSRCEAVAVVREFSRRIERVNGSFAEEVKRVFYVELAAVGGGSMASASRASILWNQKSLEAAIDYLSKKVSEELSKSLKASPIKPFQIGRSKVILSGEAAPALIHEVSHLLDPTYVGTAIMSRRIASESFNLVDDPFYPESPATRFFDDEGVATARRTLIESGTVVDLHNTRATAARTQLRPGSAYGLFHVPIPFHTTLRLEPGDWRLEEALSEMREGYLVEGVAAATTEKGYIRVIPTLAYRVEKGEELQPVKLSEVRIPIRSLRTVWAVGRKLFERQTLEKDYLVAEVAPFIGLEAYVT